MNKRLREARLALHLSQEYVAKQMGLPRTAIIDIESGKRKVKTDELVRFSKIYGISTDELLNGTPEEMPKTAMFARAFSELNDQDQQEIMNLIDFKRRYKAGTYAN